MPARFCLDHHVQAELVIRLRNDGHDVITALEAGMDRADDEPLLEFATREGRILYTQNVRDFEPLRRRWEAEGREHSGLMYSAFVSAGLIHHWITAALALYPGMHNVTVPLGSWLNDVTS